MDVLIGKTAQSDLKADVLPMLYNAFDSTTPQIQVWMHNQHNNTISQSANQPINQSTNQPINQCNYSIIIQCHNSIQIELAIYYLYFQILMHKLNTVRVEQL